MGVTINGRPIEPQNNVPLGDNINVPTKKVIDELALKTAR
jgi:pSer/pThr/pTyr-binding forkhead associated (FHA) protein